MSFVFTHAQVLWPGAQLIAARLLGQQAAGEVINQETSAAGKSTASSSSVISALQGESSRAVQVGRGAQQWAGKRVLCVGCGTGLEALAASVGGGASVVATDTNPLPLALLRLAAADCVELQPNKMSKRSRRSGSGGTLRTAFFDILNPANVAPEELDEGKDSLTYDGPVFGASLDESSEMITWGQGGGEDLLSSCDLLVRLLITQN
jgi:SAM-dependent methyltransferase